MENCADRRERVRLVECGCAHKSGVMVTTMMMNMTLLLTADRMISMILQVSLVHL